jgi:S-layer homology domain
MLNTDRHQLKTGRLNTRSISVKTTKSKLVAILVFSLTILTNFTGDRSVIAQSLEPVLADRSPSEKLSFIPKVVLEIQQVPSSQKNVPAASNTTHNAQQIAQATDVAGNWAEPFIRILVEKGIISSYPDGNFRPDKPVSRAEFAALLNKAFDLQQVREGAKFKDVPTKYWAAEVIQKAYRGGFLTDYPNKTFAPNQNILRIESLVSLTNGRKLSPSGNLALNNVFGDAAQVPSYGQNSLIAATQNCLAVSKEYDSTKLPGGNFGPNTVATRADVAAYIHQTLVAAGKLPALSKDSIGNKYIASCPQGVYVTSIQSPETLPSKTPAPPSNQIVNADFINNLKIEPLATLANADQPSSGANSPGLTFATPSAFGAGFGDVFIGGSASTAGRLRPDVDGSLSAGFGLGSSNTLGLEVSYNMGSIKTFGANGSFDLKAHRVIHSEGTNQIGIAAGWNTFAQYGNEGVVPSTVYGAISSYSQLQSNNSYNKMPLSITVGAGGGTFRQGDASLGIFAGAGVQVHPQLGVGLGWSGVGLNAGLSFVPNPSIPLTIGLTGGDLGNNSPGGSVLVLNVGYGFNFLPR